MDFVVVVAGVVVVALVVVVVFVVAGRVRPTGCPGSVHAASATAQVSATAARLSASPMVSSMPDGDSTRFSDRRRHSADLR